MTRRFVTLLLALPIALCATTLDSSAIGLGLYGGTRFGNADWHMDDIVLVDPNLFEFNADLDPDGDVRGVRLGFVLDTAPAQDRLFNYRLNLGWEGFEADWDSIDVDSSIFTGSASTGDVMKMSGLASEHTFGFGIVRVNMFRLWLGPRIRVGLYRGKLEDGDIEKIAPYDVDIVLGEFGIAPVVGANLNLGRVVTLGVTGGYMVSGYAGVIGDIGDEDTDITGTGTDGFVNGVLMFRMGADAR